MIEYVVLGLVVIITTLWLTGHLGEWSDRVVNHLVGKAASVGATSITGNQQLMSIFTGLLDRIEPVHASLDVSDNFCSINYMKGGTKYVINLPYYNRIDPKYKDVLVYLCRGAELIELKQDLSIPYFVDASTLGGDAIELRCEDRMIRLGAHEIPTLTKINELFTSVPTPPSIPEPETEKQVSPSFVPCQDSPSDT